MVASRRGGRAWLVLAALAFTALVAAGAPLDAAVFDASNADKVDGKHAVGAGATAGQRAGKLVATNDAGRLPGSIIAKAPDTDTLDGLNSTVFQRRVTGTCSSTQKMLSVGFGGGVACGLDRIDGGNAAMLDGVDSLQRRGTRTIVLRPSGSPLDNGLELVATLANLTPAPSVSNPWLVHLEPGVYDVSDVENAGFLPTLVVPSFVTLEGSGPGTVIACYCNGAHAVLNATVLMAPDSELRDLKVTNTAPAPGDTATGIRGLLDPADTATVRRVSVDVSGPAFLMFGIQAYGSMAVSDVDVTAAGGSTAVGVFAVQGEPTVSNSTIRVAGGDTNSYGIAVQDASVQVTSSSVTAEGTLDADNNDALVVFSGDAIVRGSTLTAIGGSATSVSESEGDAFIATSGLTASPLPGIDGSPVCVHSYNGNTLTRLTENCLPPVPEPPPSF